jgi:hypothetical protein
MLQELKHEGLGHEIKIMSNINLEEHSWYPPVRGAT